MSESKIFTDTRTDDSAIEKSCTHRNYCDNESIFVIFEALKCSQSALQFERSKSRMYVIDVWCAKCEATVWAQIFWCSIYFRIEMMTFLFENLN